MLSCHPGRHGCPLSSLTGGSRQQQWQGDERSHPSSPAFGLGPAFILATFAKRYDLQCYPVGIPWDSPKVSASKERASSVSHLFNKYLLSVCCGLGAVPGSRRTGTWKAKRTPKTGAGTSGVGPQVQPLLCFQTAESIWACHLPSLGHSPYLRKTEDRIK